MTEHPFFKHIQGRSTALGYVFLRGLMFLLLPYSAYLGFGDLLSFYRMAQIPGWPFFQYWVEFPPVFPFISASIYRLTAGNEHSYCYLLGMMFTLFDAGSILVFWQLLLRTNPEKTARLKLIGYALVLCFLPYSRWYFDAIPVFFLLLGLWLVLANKPGRAGFWIAAGFLTKLFPTLALIAAWLYPKKRNFFFALTITSLLSAVVIGGLWLASPQMTAASLSAQYAKGSWQTVWALLDGNLNTGNFGPLGERLTPGLAFRPQGNPPVIPAIFPLIGAGLAGLWLIWKARIHSDLQRAALVGAGWTLLILASPGWSPQWILYIIPFCLMAFTGGKAAGFIIGLAGLSLTEWPLLFSRGRVDLIWMVVIIRTLVMVLLCGMFFARVLQRGEEISLSTNTSEA